MTRDVFSRVKEVFLAACEKPSAERAEFVRQQASGNDEIVREVEALLREHERPTQLLASDPVGPLEMMGLPKSAIEKHSAPMNITGLEPDGIEVGERDTKNKTGTISDGPGSRSGYVDAGRFTAGTVVDERYRVIELLGRGGMGEVYRADDLRLEQTVALKFLPALFGKDAKWLERFNNEVRLSRQVSHPNVCRVFDIGEYKGEPFISMEYVDGENLARLLRRIGRVPQDKAVQIARQLCAGLAAAHERGVLHRDLKPANVMIDERGHVRITDFGLAAPADEVVQQQLRAGTPAYMSPEQLLGKTVTTRSDIYALGLVMYEMFTGKPAFEGESFRDYQKAHSEMMPAAPSAIVPDIDPTIERVIMRCLEKNPKHRYASVLAVSAALPGGDALRAALAAGQTPSPEAVAAAGDYEFGLRRTAAVSIFAAALVLLALVVWLAPQAFVIQKVIDDKPPAVLADRAEQILSDLRYTNRRDRAYGFAVEPRAYNEIERQDDSPQRWRRLGRDKPDVIYFWYRAAPNYLVPVQAGRSVSINDPPLDEPGMVAVRLNPQGKLIGFEAVPRSLGAARSDDADCDWPALLQAAGADLSRFKEVPSRLTPPRFADSRKAWQGSFSEHPDRIVRIEAAAYGGQVVFFDVNNAVVAVSTDAVGLNRPNMLIQVITIIVLLIFGSVLAWRNHRSGRGDRQGAMRLAMAFLVLGGVAWAFRVHYVPDIVQQYQLFTQAMGEVLFLVGLVWVFYMAVEPSVRRIWPETIISWTRFISGRLLDPLVGRDILIGGAAGIGTVLLSQLDQLMPRWLNQPAPMPNIDILNEMLQAPRSLSVLFQAGVNALYVGMIAVLFVVVARMMTKRRWAAGALFVIMFAAMTVRYEPHGYINWIVQALIGAAFLLVLIRHGLVAIIACCLARFILLSYPITYDFSVWYGNSVLIALGALLAMLGVSFYVSLAGKSLLDARMLDS